LTITPWGINLEKKDKAAIFGKFVRFTVPNYPIKAGPSGLPIGRKVNGERLTITL
jgi:hypothetical protein